MKFCKKISLVFSLLKKNSFGKAVLRFTNAVINKLELLFNISDGGSVFFRAKKR